MTPDRLIEIKKEVNAEYEAAKEDFEKNGKANKYTEVVTIESKEVSANTDVVELGEIAKEMVSKYPSRTNLVTELFAKLDCLGEVEGFEIQLYGVDIRDKRKFVIYNRVRKELNLKINANVENKFNTLLELFIDQDITYEHMINVLYKYSKPKEGTENES